MIIRTADCVFNGWLGFDYDAAACRHRVANADSWMRRRERLVSEFFGERCLSRVSRVRIRLHLGEGSFVLIPVVNGDLRLRRYLASPVVEFQGMR